MRGGSMPSEGRPAGKGKEKESSFGEAISRCSSVPLRRGMRVITLIQDKDGNRTVVADAVYLSNG